MFLKKSLLFSISVVLFSLTTMSSLAQTFVPGYIVENDGDTLKGFVSHQNDFKTVYFKKGLDERFYDTHTPKNIRGFGSPDQIYESAAVKIDQSSYWDATPSGSSLLSFVQDTVFLFTVVKGPKSIYSMSSGNRIQFYIKVGNKFELLIYQKISIEKDGKEFVKNNNQFTTQLSTYLQDCPRIARQISNLDYDEKNFKRIMLKYYECIGSDSKKNQYDVYSSPKGPLTFGVLAGAAITDIELPGDGNKYFANSPYTPSTNFSPGVYMGFALGKEKKRWMLFNELLYTSYSGSSKYHWYSSDDYYTNASGSLEVRTGRLNSMFRFQQPLGKSTSLFLNLGISNGFATRKYGDRTIATTLVKKTTIRVEPGSESDIKYDFGVLGGLGFQGHRFSLQARFHNSFSSTDRYGFRLNQQQFVFLAGFRLY